MKQLITLFIILILPEIAFSQEIISTSGQRFEAPTGSVEFTIGEVIIPTIESPSRVLTQGFHQTRINFVSIENHKTEIEISVFPNPTSDYITINSEINTELSIFDINSKLIRTLNTEPNMQVDLSDLAAGTYFLVFNNSKEKLKTIKIIVQ